MNSELTVLLLFFGLTALCIKKADDWGKWAFIVWLIGNVIMTYTLGPSDYDFQH
tara:strand:+ start:529 stop:690 length:162 start_codon:yes stop_codon:yes gene_type:complete